jgi:hypothetical protein
MFVIGILITPMNGKEIRASGTLSRAFRYHTILYVDMVLLCSIDSYF